MLHGKWPPRPDRARERPGVGVPDADGVVAGRAGEESAVGAEGQGPDGRRVAFQPAQLAAGVRVPDPDVPVAVGRGQAAAVRAVGHRDHGAGPLAVPLVHDREDVAMAERFQVPPLPAPQLGRALVEQSLGVADVAGGPLPRGQPDPVQVEAELGLATLLRLGMTGPVGRRQGGSQPAAVRPPRHGRHDRQSRDHRHHRQRGHGRAAPGPVEQPADGAGRAGPDRLAAQESSQIVGHLAGPSRSARGDPWRSP